MLVPFLQREATAEPPRPSNPMFKWLAKQFTREEDDTDSIGSEAGLRTFIETLPTVQPARTIEAIGEQFENARTLEVRPDRLRRALLRLDDRAQAPLADIWPQLFNDDPGRTLSDAHWLTLARYFRNVQSGYRHCLESLPEAASLSDGDRTEAIHIAARAMSAMARHKLLLRLRYRDVDTAYWTGLNALATRARLLGGNATLAEIYPNSGVQTSFEREYLVALLFDVAPIANLLPMQMYVLDLVLRRYAANYFLSDTLRDSAPFALDPARNEPPQRWLKGLPPRPGLAFFGIGSAYAQFAGLRKAAHATGELPEWAAHTHCDVVSYRNMLDLLVAHWSLQPPQRRQRRERVEGEVLAVHGLGLVRRMIAASEYAKTGGRLSYQENTPYDVKIFGQIRFGSVGEKGDSAVKERPVTPMEILQKFELEGDRQMTERWTISDVSAGGMGVVAHAHAGWARVGMLVGFRQPESLEWQLALIRRLSRTVQGKLSIGLQRIAGTTHCARLRIGDGKEANAWVAVAGGGDAFHDAILLRDEGTTLLIEHGIFKGPLECNLSFEKRWNPVRLEGIIDHGLDYDRVEMTFLESLSRT